MEEIHIYPESNQYLDWAHKVTTYENHPVMVTEKEYERLVAYDRIAELRTEFLEELYKR